MLALAIAWASPAAMLAPLFAPASAVAQYQAPSEKLFMSGKSAVTWRQGDADIIQIEGPVSLELERATLSAKQAVLWLTPEAGNEPNRMKVQVVLIGDGKVIADGAVRSGERMLVNASVAGRVRLTAVDRAEKDLSGSDLYKLADSIRNPGAAPVVAVAPAVAVAVANQGPTTHASSTQGAAPAPAEPSRTAAPIVAVPLVVAATGPSTAPTTFPAGSATVLPAAPVFFEAPELELIETNDGTVAAVLSKGVKLMHRRANGDLIELQGHRVVLFTPLKDLKELQKGGRQIKEIQDAVTAAYIEGDARIVYTPADQRKIGEQRLEAARVYYEFTRRSASSPPANTRPRRRS